MPKTTKKAEAYALSIKVLGKTYTSKGETVKEGLQNLKVGNVAKGMSVLRITKGGVAKDKVIPPAQTAKLFSLSPLMREIAIKNVSLMFQGL